MNRDSIHISRDCLHRSSRDYTSGHHSDVEFYMKTVRLPFILICSFQKIEYFFGNYPTTKLYAITISFPTCCILVFIVSAVQKKYDLFWTGGAAVAAESTV